MLCALYRDRSRQVPLTRLALYPACCEMLINRHESERSITLKDYPALNAIQKETLLEDLAYWTLLGDYLTSLNSNGTKYSKKDDNPQNGTSRRERLPHPPAPSPRQSEPCLLVPRGGRRRGELKAHLWGGVRWTTADDERWRRSRWSRTSARHSNHALYIFMQSSIELRPLIRGEHLAYLVHWK